MNCQSSELPDFRNLLKEKIEIEQTRKIVGTQSLKTIDGKIINTNYKEILAENSVASTYPSDPKWKPCSVKLYDIGPDLNGRTTVSFERKRGPQPKALHNLLRSSCNMPVVRDKNEKKYLWIRKTNPLKLKLAESDVHVSASPSQPQVSNNPIVAKNLSSLINNYVNPESLGTFLKTSVNPAENLGSLQAVQFSGDHFVCSYNVEENKTVEENKPVEVTKNEEEKRPIKKVLKLSQTKMPDGKFVYKLNKGDSSSAAILNLIQMPSAKTIQVVIPKKIPGTVQASTVLPSTADVMSMVNYNATRIDAALETPSADSIEVTMTDLSECPVCHLQNVPREHEEIEHTSWNFVCHLCSIGFRTQLARNLHSSIHLKAQTDRQSIKCSLCNSLFSGPSCESDLELHVLAIHKIGEYTKHKGHLPCPVCKKTFAEKSLMRAHIDHHKPITSHCTCGTRPCHNCSINPPVTESTPVKPPAKPIMQHVALVENQGVKRLGVVKEPNILKPMKQCDVCQLYFWFSKNHMENHNISAKQPHFRCSVCDAKFTQKEIAQLHMKIHFMPRPEVPKYMHCSFCNMACQNLSDHFALYHPHNKLSRRCRYCGTLTGEQGLLLLHEQQHWPKECKCGRAACKMCMRNVFQPTPTQDGTSGSVMQASVCDAFSDFQVEKTECFICKMRFVDQADSFEKFTTLEKHIRVEHSLRSKFRCSMCKAGFMHRNIAQLHLHVHTGLNLTVRKECSLCKASNVTDFPAHLLEKHSAIHRRHQFRCALCGLVILEENMYRMHLLSHFPPATTTKNGDEDVVMITPSEDATKSMNFSGQTDKLERACQVCYILIPNMEEHAEEHRPNKAKYRCRVCKVTFNTEVMSSMHARIHCYKYPAISLQCTICSQKFKNGPALIDHALEHHSISNLRMCNVRQCSICHEKFPEKNSLEAHKALHMPKYCKCKCKECKYCSYYTCKHCGEYFDPGLKAYFLQHAEHCNEVAESEKKTKKLPNAPLSSQVIKIARVAPYSRSDSTPKKVLGSSSHIRSTQKSSSGPVLIDSDSDEPKTVNESSGSTECMSCGIQIRSGTIAAHMRQYHNKPMDLFICKVCNYKAPNADFLLRHRVRHLSHNHFHCLFCSEHFPEWNTLLAHNYTMHFTARRRCNLCSMYFSELDLLKKHNAQSDWDQPHHLPCNFCCRSFKTFSAYEEHKVVHGTICNCGKANCLQCNKFKCSCSAVFKAHQFVQYMLHMRSCYQCYNCDLNFDSVEDLQKHEKTHYYKCEVCGVQRRYKRNIVAHMQLHNCQCPADNVDCLFCKKAWCTICRKRFLRAELANYDLHKQTCIESDLLCICREKDCIICQNAQCSHCQRVFKKHRFSSFSAHVKACMGDHNDPFAPAPKRIKIKEEPIDLEYTRKRRVVDSTVVDLDSDEEKDKQETSESTAMSLVDTEASGTRNLEDIQGTESHNITDPNTIFPTEPDQDTQETSEPDTTTFDGFSSEFPTEQDSRPESVSSRLDRDTGTPAEEQGIPAKYLDIDHLIFGAMDNSQPSDNWSELITVTPQERRGNETSQPSSSYFSTSPTRYDTPLDSNLRPNEQGVFCVTPSDEAQDTPPTHRVINICPEGDMDSEMTHENDHEMTTRDAQPVNPVGTVDDMVMEQYVIEPVARIDPATSFSFRAGEADS